MRIHWIIYLIHTSNIYNTRENFSVYSSSSGNTLDITHTHQIYKTLGKTLACTHHHLGNTLDNIQTHTRFISTRVYTSSGNKLDNTHTHQIYIHNFNVYTSRKYTRYSAQ